MNRKGNPNWKKGQTVPGATPFKPGQSGNPQGYSRKKRMQDLIEAELDELAANGEHNKAKAIIKAIVDKAVDGNLQAAEMVLERTDGPVTNVIDLKATVSSYDLSKLDTKTLKSLEQILGQIAEPTESE